MSLCYKAFTNLARFKARFGISCKSCEHERKGLDRCKHCTYYDRPKRIHVGNSLFEPKKELLELLRDERI